MSDHLRLIVLASELYEPSKDNLHKRVEYAFQWSSVFKLEEEYIVLAPWLQLLASGGLSEPEPRYGHHKNII